MFAEWRIRLSRWHNGCAKFNLKHSRWRKSEGKFPTCTICGGSGWWIWGYKHFKPDYVAQRLQGNQPDASSAYWAEHDGHIARP